MMETDRVGSLVWVVGSLWKANLGHFCIMFMCVYVNIYIYIYMHTHAHLKVEHQNNLDINYKSDK